MKTDLKNYDLTDFILKEDMFCGTFATLIIPKNIGCKWTQKNKIFRSSIWDFEGNLISASLPKFVNFSENPEHFPVPNTLNNCKIIDKIDGSLCIIDYYNNQFSMRTRGTLSLDSTENVTDFYECIKKYPLLKEWLIKNNNYSLLCEITTPNQKIVLDYGNEPDFWLIGTVDKTDYSLMTQENLDSLSKLIGVKRPEYYKFTSMDNLLESVKKLTNKEGCCLYSNNDQTIHKVKALQYLKCHAFKGNATFENTIEMFFELDMPSYQDFETKIIEKFDYECYQMVRGYISTICDGYKEVLNVVDGMTRFVDKIKPLPTRKEQSIAVFSSYGKESNRSSYIFTILDGKSLSKEQLKKLLYQVTKK